LIEFFSFCVFLFSETMTNSSTTNTFANTTQVDCTVHHTCDSCLAHWACVWCPNVVDVGSTTNTMNITTTTTTTTITHHAAAAGTNAAAHCAHFSNPLSKAAPLCPQWEYRVCGVAGWITLSVGAALVVLFLLALACLCWCCWCRGRCCNGGNKRRRRHYRNMQQSAYAPNRVGQQQQQREQLRRRRCQLGPDEQRATPLARRRRRCGSSSPSFHSTPTPITDKRRRDMANKWGVAGAGSSLTGASPHPHLQTAAYSSEPSNAPPLDNVYFSSIN
jgi:hypothetical protein